MTDSNQTTLEFKNGSKINFKNTSGKNDYKGLDNRFYPVGNMQLVIDLQIRINALQNLLIEYQRLTGKYKLEKSLNQYLRNIILNKNKRFIANIILNGDIKNT
ncbi:MAG: hypothetical protein WC358_08325 [Ignavibacteria bacterium]|jgi:hypothetical protein